ncbi:hypothetical protein [Candidatus Reidiella endopervernicosa]|uniref:Uncharacterized protein n=1 Tax=Candidatus Reidiella endopervernicosa TaxID=2738883 RepID=A0A6N0HZL3_9GAMM|nr:hypothetical protein [Candidatus Reidiella endopervernicosa]QKQ27759.1 hypothetical protein HUE57_16810 [Candidatus Reidiella endopervernicosa]
MQRLSLRPADAHYLQGFNQLIDSYSILSLEQILRDHIQVPHDSYDVRLRLIIINIQTDESRLQLYQYT